jgi:hypothetical protein
MKLRLTILFGIVIISSVLRAQSIRLLVRGEKFIDTTIPVSVGIFAYHAGQNEPTLWVDTVIATIQPFQKRKFEKRINISHSHYRSLGGARRIYAQDTSQGDIDTTVLYYFDGSKNPENSLRDIDTGELNYISFVVGSHRQRPIDTTGQLWLIERINHEVLHYDRYEQGSSSYPFEQFQGHKYYISRLSINGGWFDPGVSDQVRDDKNGVAIKLQDFIQNRVMIQPDP